MPSSSKPKKEKATLARSTARKHINASEKRLAQLKRKLELVQLALDLNKANSLSARRPSPARTTLAATVSGTKRSQPLGGFQSPDVSSKKSKKNRAMTAVASNSSTTATPSSVGSSKRSSRRVAVPKTSPLSECVKILNKLSTFKSSVPFRKPVTIAVAADYFDFIKHPMDFSTVKRKLDVGEYKTPYEFAADMRLVFSNALHYNNGVTSPIGKKAVNSWGSFENHFMHFTEKFERNELRASLCRVMKATMCYQPEIAGWFLFPVPWRKLGITDYPTRISRPMDLSTIANKLGSYTSLADFLSDCKLIWANCESYNGLLSPVTQAGFQVRDYLMKRVAHELPLEWTALQTQDPDFIDLFPPSQLTMQSIGVASQPSSVAPTSSSKTSALFVDTNNASAVAVVPELAAVVQPPIEVSAVAPAAVAAAFEQVESVQEAVAVESTSAPSTEEVDVEMYAAPAAEDEDDEEFEDMEDPAVAQAFIAKMSRKNEEDYVDLEQLSFRQKEDLEKGVSCLEGDHLESVVEMLRSLVDQSDSDEMELDIDMIEPSMQVRLYVYLIKALRSQQSDFEESTRHEMLVDEQLPPAEASPLVAATVNVEGEGEEAEDVVAEAQQVADASDVVLPQQVEEEIPEQVDAAVDVEMVDVSAAVVVGGGGDEEEEEEEEVEGSANAVSSSETVAESPSVSQEQSQALVASTSEASDALSSATTQPLSSVPTEMEANPSSVQQPLPVVVMAVAAEEQGEEEEEERGQEEEVGAVVGAVVEAVVGAEEEKIDFPETEAVESSALNAANEVQEAGGAPFSALSVAQELGITEEEMKEADSMVPSLSESPATEMANVFENVNTNTDAAAEGGVVVEQTEMASAKESEEEEADEDLFGAEESTELEADGNGNDDDDEDLFGDSTVSATATVEMNGEAVPSLPESSEVKLVQETEDVAMATASAEAGDTTPLASALD